MHPRSIQDAHALDNRPALNQAGLRRFAARGYTDKAARQYKAETLTQYDDAERKTAEGNKALAELMHDPNRPTRAEIEQLRARRPSLWNRYPVTACRPE